MIVHVEYVNLKKLEALFAILAQKYGMKLAGFCFHFDKKASLAPYRLLRKKVSQIVYHLPASALNAKLVGLCNRMRMDLNITVNTKLTGGQKKLFQGLERATVVYAACDDTQTLEFLQSQPQLLVCSPSRCDALEADLFHLAVYQKQAYQCKCSSCLSNILYITKQDDVCFCPFYPEKSRLCGVDFDGDYFDNDAFVQVLEREIAKRDECKSKCAYYSLCHGGCAMEDVCEFFQKQYPVIKERACNIINEQKSLDELPLFEQEGILRGVSQGK